MEAVNHYSETDLGNVSPNPGGEYDPKEAYEYLDLVSYQGGSYLCLTELGTTIIGTAPEPGHNTEFWQMLTLPGGLTSEYVAMHDDVVNKAAQVENSRAAVEQAQQEVEASQADVQQLHEDTVQAAQEAENSRDSAAGYAQSAEQSRKAAAESEQNINAQMTGLNQKVSELVTKAQKDISAARQQAIDTITTQEDTSTEAVEQVGNAALESARQALRDINTAGQQAVQTVTDQQNASVQAVKDETNSYIEEKRQEISAKTDEVTQAVTQAGEKQLQDIANSLDSTFTESGKAADAKAVGDAIASVEESKANKSALATTDRKLDALWKLNQGITYQFEVDSEPAYQKTIPTGAQMASVKQIGGKAIVWNQLIDSNWFINSTSKEGVSFNNDNGLVTITENGERTSVSYSSAMKNNPSVTKGHKYYISGFYDDKHLLSNGNGFSSIVECLDSGTTDLRISIKINDVLPITLPIQLFDLTKMFGAGNEPSTVEEFEAMFPKDYYPFNAGKLLNMALNEVEIIGKNRFECICYSTMPITTLDGLKLSNPYGTTIKSIEPSNSITVAQSYAPNQDTPSSYKNGFFCVQIKKLTNNKKYVFSFDVIPYNMILSNALIIALLNGKTNTRNDSKQEIQENKRIRLHFEFTYTDKADSWYFEIRNSGISGVFENFQIEEGSINTDYAPYTKKNYPIPQSIQSLDGYGWSTGNANNYIDFENKKYHKYVDKRDFKDGDFANTSMITDGTNTYYELVEPIVTDISDIISDTFQEPFEVETGGSLMFKNSNGDGYKVPVPNTVEYTVKLSEVGGTTE